MVDLFYVIKREFLIHYSCNIHGIHAFFASRFIIGNFVVLTDFINKT